MAPHPDALPAARRVHKVRAVKYLNNIVEQAIERATSAMLTIQSLRRRQRFRRRGT